MNKLIIKKYDSKFNDNYFSYHSFLSFTQEAFILSTYLCSDIPPGSLEDEKKFILSMPLHEEFPTNESLTCMTEEGFEISWLFNPNSAVVCLTRENIIEILDKWQKIRSLKSNWIVINFNKDSVSMTPYNELPNEELGDPEKCYSADFAAYDLYEKRIASKKRTCIENFFIPFLKK